MNQKQLLCHSTPRIDLLCRLSEPYITIADIGCDHAYVSIHLARMGKSVIASDIAEGPISKARKNILAFGLENKIDIRLCGGLSGLKKGEAEEIIIAGMGGNIISEILRDGMEIAKESKVLFLQPMTSPEVLRKFLYENDFLIKEEHLVKEDRRIYTIMEVCTGETENFCEFDCFVSKQIAKNINLPLYREYAKKIYKKFEKIISGLEKSESKADLLSYYIPLYERAKNILDI